MFNVLVLGKDKRSEYLSDIICQSDLMEVVYIKTEDLSIDDISGSFDTIVLPIPTKIDDNGYFAGSRLLLSDIFNYYAESLFVYSSLNDLSQFQPNNNYNLSLNEEYLNSNALLTAKALFDIARFDNCDNNYQAMIVGMGRIGRHLGALLDKTNIKYTIASSSMRHITQYDNCTRIIQYSDICKEIRMYKWIINTAPYRYFDNQVLDDYDGTYYELASYPYGFEYIENELPKSVVMCPGLPGKYYPLEAAQIIFETIKDKIFEVTNDE